MKTSLLQFAGLLLTCFVLLFSCEIEQTEYDLLTTERCTETDVVIDPFIVTDFECQSNIEISGVSVIRNPSETGINLSKFVGEYTDGASATDGLSINFSGGLDLSTNALFKFKVKTTITGTLQIQLLGGSSGIVTYDIIVSGNNTWTEYELDLIDQRNETFTEFLLIFNNGIQNSGQDVYLLDDIKFDPTIDPCEGITTDLSVINDFDCQQNFFLGDDPTQTSAPLIDNPFMSGINTSAHVGTYTDNGTEAFDNLLIEFGAPIDLSQNALFKLKVYATMTAPLLVKLEGGSTPIEIAATINTVNQWVEYSFNFTDAIGSGNTTMVIFFNAGNTNGSMEDVYYIDDLRFEEFIDPCAGVTPDLSIISDFECQQNYTLGVNPAVISVVENIDTSGVNMSDFVGEYLDDGTQPFDNLLINFGTSIDLSTTPLLKIKVYSSMTAPLLAKLEGGTPLEIFADIDVVNQWKEYTFDFTAAIGQGNTTLVLFFNAGQNNGTVQDSYFIDDIQFVVDDCAEIVADCTGVTPDLTIIADFDCQQNYNLGNDPTINDAPTVQNPNVDCGNRSSNVGQYIDDGTAPFDNLFINLNTAFDLSANSTFRMKVLTSNPTPLPVLAKLEGGTAVEIFADITVTGEWVELSFDFTAAIGAGNDKLVLFFNAGQTNGTTTDIYHIDDLRFE